MQNFRDLNVWQKSHQLALDIYRDTDGYPQSELYGLTSQIRRAGASIPANIAEGCGRGSNADMARFLSYAMGSACELESLILLSRDLGFVTEEDHGRIMSAVVEVKKMLASLLTRVRSRQLSQATAPPTDN